MQLRQLLVEVVVLRACTRETVTSTRFAICVLEYYTGVLILLLP